jgi:hypothetical protein
MSFDFSAPRFAKEQGVGGSDLFEQRREGNTVDRSLSEQQ